jgi:hypothetical protein
MGEKEEGEAETLIETQKRMKYCILLNPKIQLYLL